MGNSDTSPMDVRVALCQVLSRGDVRSNLDEVGKIPWVILHYRKYKWVKDLTRNFES